MTPRNAAGSRFDVSWDSVMPRIFDRAPVAIFDARSVIVFASAALRQIIGRDEAVGLNYGVIAPVIAQPSFFDAMRQAIAQEGCWRGEIEIRQPDGSPRWLDTTISDFPGQPGLYLALHVDVTAEKQLRRSEEFYRNVARISPDGFFINDGKTTISVNDAGVRMLRARDAGEIIGRTPAQLFHPDCIADVESIIARQIQTPGLFEPAHEATMIAMDGTQVPVEVRSVSHMLDGRPVTFAACRDLTAYKENERRLSNEIDFANAIFNGLPSVVFQYDLEGRLLRWNQNNLSVTGYSQEEYQTMRALDFFPDEDRAAVAGAIARGVAQGEATVEAHLLTKDGRKIPYHFIGVLLDKSDPPSFVGIGTDMSLRKQAEEELREKTAVLEAAFESSIDGIMMTDPKGNRLLTNRRFTEILKMPPEFIANPSGQLPYVASLTADPQGFIDQALGMYVWPNTNASLRDEFEINTGTVIERVSEPVRSADGHNYGRIWVYRDITEERRTQNRVIHLAHFDFLTGLANRYNLQEHMAARLSRADDGGFGLLSIDLDGFKLINDTKGHVVGDDILKQVAGRLRMICCGPDMFLARLGGDEFVCLVSDTDPGQVMALARSVVHTLTNPYLLENQRFTVGASIGVAIAPEHGATVRELLSRADIALYSAKDAGKGVAHLFEREMEDYIQAQIHMETDLRAALEHGEGLFVFYQPIVHADSGQIIAREALVRWHHKERGWVPPGVFVPLAEACGLIEQLGAFVLDRACRDAAGWADGARVAVNISAVQLGKGLLASELHASLAAAGLAPDRLEIEVTETALLGDAREIGRDLRLVRESGVRVALDDFGTGYSSLSHLRLFPFTKIKIDGSFVRDAAVRPDCAAVVRAVVDIGRDLGVSIVAEGVETEVQLACIRALGCTEIQGYIYARPAPSARDAPVVEALNQAMARG